MNKIYMDYKKPEPGDNNDWNPTTKELTALGTKIIAAARPKRKKYRPTKGRKMSKKEYIDSLEMREKWWRHYGRNPWY